MGPCDGPCATRAADCQGHHEQGRKPMLDEVIPIDLSNSEARPKRRHLGIVHFPSKTEQRLAHPHARQQDATSRSNLGWMGLLCDIVFDNHPGQRSCHSRAIYSLRSANKNLTKQIVPCTQRKSLKWFMNSSSISGLSTMLRPDERLAPVITNKQFLNCDA